MPTTSILKTETINWCLYVNLNRKKNKNRAGSFPQSQTAQIYCSSVFDPSLRSENVIAEQFIASIIYSNMTTLNCNYLQIWTRFTLKRSSQMTCLGKIFAFWGFCDPSFSFGEMIVNFRLHTTKTGEDVRAKYDAPAQTTQSAPSPFQICFCVSRSVDKYHLIKKKKNLS